MKRMITLAAIGVITLTGSMGRARGQGEVTFANSTGTAIINGQTGLPAEGGRFTVGLYYTTNLDTPIPPIFVADDGVFQLVATTPIRNNGIFIGGTVTLPSAAPGQEVLLQVRAWSDAYASYAEAFVNNDLCIGSSQVMRLALGGGTLPTPTIVGQGGFQSFVICVPEPSTYALMSLGMLVLSRAVWKRRTSARITGY